MTVSADVRIVKTDFEHPVGSSGFFLEGWEKDEVDHNGLKYLIGDDLGFFFEKVKPDEKWAYQIYSWGVPLSHKIYCKNKLAEIIYDDNKDYDMDRIKKELIPSIGIDNQICFIGDICNYSIPDDIFSKLPLWLGIDN